MRNTILFLLLQCPIVIFSQELVDFKIGKTKEEVSSYLEKLSAKAGNFSKTETMMTDSGDILLKMEFPTIAEKVRAAMVIGHFVYSEESKTDFCIKMEVIGLNEYLQEYITLVRGKCKKGDRGEWIYETGQEIDGAKALIVYRFNESDKLDHTKLFTLSAEFQTR